MQPLVPLVFHNMPSLYPPSFRRNDFYTCYTTFWLCQCNIGAKRRFSLYMQLSFPPSLFAITVDTFFFSRYAARGDRTRTAPLRRYATNHYAMLSQTSNSAHTTLNFITRGRSRRGTLSKMASFIVDSCRDQRFSLETWDGSKNDRLGSMHTSDHRRSVWYKN